MQLMINKACVLSLLRRGAAIGLAAAGLWAGAAMAGEELVAKVEAEAGTLLGKAQIAATGTSVSKLERDGDGVQVTISVPEAGHYDIVVHQATVGGGTKLNNVLANGQFVGDLKSDSASWNDSTVNYVWLEAGENTIAITKSYGWIAIDAIGVRRSEPIPADVYDVEPTLIDLRYIQSFSDTTLHHLPLFLRIQFFGNLIYFEKISDIRNLLI